MEFNTILVDNSDHISVVKINRPEKLNALNIELIRELNFLFSELKQNDDIYVVVLTGSGQKAFAAGADINEINSLNPSTGKFYSIQGQQVLNQIENLGKPVIAAVNGFALGGGCELALACHIRIASENAKFGLPEVNLGLIPGFGGTYRLAKLINSGRAAECILTGRLIEAQEAFNIGLVNKVYAQSELLTEALEMAKKIASKPQLAVRYSLDAINFSSDSGLQKSLANETSLFALCCGTDDFKEGTAAFIEKRKGNFTNR